MRFVCSYLLVVAVVVASRVVAGKVDVGAGKNEPITDEGAAVAHVCKWCPENATTSDDIPGIRFPGDLRDWFAGQALAGVSTCDSMDQDDCARWAYEVADEMIKRRAEHLKAKQDRASEFQDIEGGAP
jgi:hypothetical protein